MTVENLRATMSNTEFIDWQSYYSLKAQREELEMKKAKTRK